MVIGVANDEGFRWCCIAEAFWKNFFIFIIIIYNLFKSGVDEKSLTNSVQRFQIIIVKYFFCMYRFYVR